MPATRLLTRLAELFDVNIGTPTNGQALTYSSSTSKWVPATIAAGGMTVGSAVTGGAANRVLHEDPSQNLLTTSGFTFVTSTLTAPTVKATAGLRVDGSMNGFDGGEIYFDGNQNTAAITTAYTSTCLMVFDHRLSSSGSFSFRVGGSQKVGFDNSGNITCTGGLTQSGLMTLTAGMDVQGGPVGYGGGEIRFSSSWFSGNGIYTTRDVSNPGIFFDHRGASSTAGYFRFRVTGGTTQIGNLDATGLSLLGCLTPGAIADSAASNGSVFTGTDHSSALCWKNTSGVVSTVATIASTGLTNIPAPPLTADSDGSTITFDLAASPFHSVTLGGNRTLAISNPSSVRTFTIRLKQDATGGRTIASWWSGISWAGGSPPVLTTTPNKADLFTFLVTGVGTYDGFIAGQNI